MVYYCYLSRLCPWFHSVKAFLLRLSYNSILSFTVCFLVAILFYFYQSVCYCAAHTFFTPWWALLLLLPYWGGYLLSCCVFAYCFLLIKYSLWSDPQFCYCLVKVFYFYDIFNGTVHALTAALLSCYQRVYFYYGLDWLYLHGPALGFTLLFRGSSQCTISIPAAVFSVYFLSHHLCACYYSFRGLP